MERKTRILSTKYLNSSIRKNDFDYLNMHMVIIAALFFFISVCSSCSSPTQISTSTDIEQVIKTTLVSTKTPKKSTSTATEKITETQKEPTPTTEPDQKTSAKPLKSATSQSPKITPSPTIEATLRADEWKTLPVIPTIHPAIKDTYLLGLELGNNPQAFSKVGDCGSTPTWFLGDFDRRERFYDLGEYEYLEDVIEYYQGSFGRTSLAARSGFNASSLFVPIWSDRSQCESDEAPLACEYRQHKPSICFIMLGSNDVWHPEDFEPQMRKIIEYSLENGVIPILSTKPDNIEEDYSINDTIARLAQEYHVPFWNFWLALADLPNRGLQEDNVHLTFGKNFFDEPEYMKKAWSVRNLTALMTLDAIWQEVKDLND